MELVHTAHTLPLLQFLKGTGIEEAEVLEDLSMAAFINHTLRVPESEWLSAGHCVVHDALGSGEGRPRRVLP